MATGLFVASQYMQARHDAFGTTLDQVNEEKFIGRENAPAPTVESEEFINEMTYDEVSQIFDVYAPFNPLTLMNAQEGACQNPENNMIGQLAEFSLEETYIAFDMKENCIQK